MAKSAQAKKGSQSGKPVSKTSGKGKPVVKKRGWLLTTIYVIILLHGILGAYLVYTTMKTTYSGSSSWILGGLVLVNLANIVAVIGMWFWKQWGIYLYALAAIAALVFHTIVTGSVVLVAVYDILPVAILAYVLNLQRKRELFT